MSAGSILHVGHDICQRIPVMEKTGFAVVQTDPSINSLRAAFAREDFSAIAFQADRFAFPEGLIRETVALTDAPRLLFESPYISYDESEFDLIIPALTPPAVWLEKLQEAVAAACRLREYALRLREECASTRAHTRSLREASARIRVSPIDLNELWRGEKEVEPEPAPEPTDEKQASQVAQNRPGSPKRPD